MSSASFETGLTLAVRYLIPFVLLSFALWWTLVNNIVTEPYLDEVFHVGQAQTYWAGNWTQWDPKITTPPGLYIWSYLICAGLLLVRGSPENVGASELRATNVVAAALVMPWRLQTLLDLLRKERNTRPSGAWISHTVLNICLFPPLLFFSALYYTDILALLAVVEAYIWDVNRSERTGTKKSWFAALSANVSLQSTVFLVVGLAALVVRQTNIFWVAVFMGGLQAVRTLRQNTTACKDQDPAQIVMKSFQGQLYDPLVEDASFLDYMKTIVSLGCAALSELLLVAASVFPHLIVLASFGIFVLWNGGVVLGHKEFHTAGIHLPQMLYIWPYFVFFSWPLLLVGIANVIIPSGYLPRFFDYRYSNTNRLPRILTALGVVPLMLVVIHLNTIVHPFTLADNRHYVFYVFRLLTRTHPAIKYIVAPIYFLCAWAAFTAYGFSSTTTAQTPAVPAATVDAASTGQQQENAPLTAPKSKKKEKESKKSKRKQAAGQSPPVKEPSPAQQTQVLTPDIIAKIQAHILQRQQQLESQQIRVSFVVIWLIATTLSLITAPLVEPRYFIIPWVMWRLHLPRQATPQMFRQQLKSGRRDEVDVFKAKLATDLPELLETMWFILINVVTGYVFLYNGFEWPQEPGKIQRFMW